MQPATRPSLFFRAAVAIVMAVGGGVGAWRAKAADGAGEVMSGALRVMSFNVRTSKASDGENAWGKRTGIFFDTIRGFRPDLIGFQEVVANQYDEIMVRLPELAFSGVARDDGKRKGEWALIGFRKDRFSATGEGNFWLSETPAVPGSKSWDAALTRICSWVRLRETATGREFVFANTHFDHIGVRARREAGKVLSRELSKIAAGVPAILTGDLNVTEDDPAYAGLVRSDTPGAIEWIDAYREVQRERLPDELSFHAFKGGTTGSRIDFIFHTAHFTAIAAAIDRAKSADGHFPSDHYAVTAVLTSK